MNNYDGRYAFFDDNQRTAYAYRKKTIKSKLSLQEITQLMVNCDNQPIHSGDIVIKFKTDTEGLRLANKFKSLVNNPTIKLNIKFEKIQ
jgi:hypothetical protein